MLKELAVLLAGLVATGVTADGLMIEVSASPELPVSNLLVNASFEQGGARPGQWGISTAAPHLFRFQRVPENGRQGAFLRIDATSTVASGYCAQIAKVQPDTLYRAGAWVRLRGGYALLWMHAYVKGRRYDQRAKLFSWGGNALVPDFVPLELTRSPPPDAWRWLGCEFRTWEGQSQVNMHLGSFFERGSMDFDDAFLGLARTTLNVKIAGDEIVTVTVKNAAGNACWESGALPAKTTLVEHALSGVPTDTRYQISVKTASGKEVAKWYPDDN